MTDSVRPARTMDKLLPILLAGAGAVLGYATTQIVAIESKIAAVEARVEAAENNDAVSQIRFEQGRVLGKLEVLEKIILESHSGGAVVNSES